jgi:hypothetical protein
MEIRKFRYKDVNREIIVFEESDQFIKGLDITKFDEEEKREAWRTLAKDTDLSEKTPEEAKAEYEKFREAFTTFRHFKKALIQ